jgi:hypothetical protein
MPYVWHRIRLDNYLLHFLTNSAVQSLRPGAGANGIHGKVGPRLALPAQIKSCDVVDKVLP